MGNQVEGYFEKGQKTVIIEDLVSTGKSSLQVCEVVRKEGLEVVGMVSIFTYGFPIAAEAFKTAGIPLFSFTNYPTLINLAIEKGLVEPQVENTLLNWANDPAGWQRI